MATLSKQPYDALKRALDLAASASLLVLLTPLLGLTALLVAHQLGRPVIFTQPRPGRGGHVFTLYKFRSMRVADPARGWMTDEQRLTDFGRLLRSTSLDELPSLVNVLRGEMSFVGPRPLLVEYLGLYTPAQSRRHEVRPGITGLAQAYGRNALTWEERFRLDVQYVDNRSFALDTRILIATARSVFRRHGISAEGHATMRRFGGTDV